MSHRILILFLAVAALLCAQAKPEPDIITLSNGDKLAGHFVKANSSTVTFHSEILGDLVIEWANVKELHTSVAVAVVPKGVKIKKHGDTSAASQGTLAVTDQKIQLTPAKTIPVADANVVIDQPSFQKAVNEKPGFFSDWKGAITGGATLVEATQNSRTFTAGIGLVRNEPTQSWIDPSNRTAFNLTESYGTVTQPNT